MGGLWTKRTHEVPTTYHSIVSQYEGRCDWLNNTKFLRDLESDSVDSDILDEELRSLELHEEKTCRRRTAKVLESSPLQIALCVLVILDAAIVLSEILIDLHAMRIQSVAATSDLALAVEFIEHRFADELSGFDQHHHGVKDMLRHLNNGSDSDHRHAVGRQRRSESNCFMTAVDRMRYCRALGTSASERPQRHRHQHVPAVHDPSTAGKDRNQLYRPRRRHTGNSMTTTRYNGDEESGLVAVETHPDDSSRSATSLKSVIHSHVSEHRRRRPKFAERKRKRSATSDSDAALSVTSSTPAAKYHDVSGSSKTKHDYRHYYEKKVKYLLKAAHILHYCSIAILGIFVIQVFTRLFALGTEFFREKLEIFDAIIVIASFVLDVVFLDGMTEVSEGEQAAALIMIFLLWRVLRIVNGLMITSKKRQEFRIKLQKRARQRLEKRMETLREDYDLLQKEKANLKALCTNKGATDEELAMCKPRRRTVVQMTTMTGLSSIASLSLGLSMSMSTGGEPSAKDRTAKLQSQLSMIAAPNNNTSKPRRASLNPPPYSSAVLPPPAAPTPTSTPTPGDATPLSSRPSIRRQAALYPSPVTEHTPLKDEPNPAPDDEQLAKDGQVTVVSF